MKDKYIKLENLDIVIPGNGTSLWCGDASKGNWKITSGELRGCCLDDPECEGGIWELQLFGPKTEWNYYTDAKIEKEVNKVFKPIVSEKIGRQVKKITWSEQGMQPDEGWSFDVIIR